MTALEVRGLCKSFGALAVTHDVSLTVAAGEIHALIGPNGAGKTSLIGQIAGTLVPDRGVVLLDGAEVTRLPPHRRARRGLARTVQVSSLIDGFSARENVALVAQAGARHPLRPFGTVARDAGLNAAADAALASVGLDARADTPARDLSHGERRALEIACALAQAPRIVLFDEPLAGMGHAEAARIVDLLRGLRGRFAMPLVEHDMDAVFALADRISVLVAGRVIASGTPAAVRADAGVREAYLGEPC